MNKKSGCFTVINGVADADAQQNQTRVARPLATCLVALFSIALGTSVGLVIPIGVPYGSATAVAAPSISQSAYFPPFNLNPATAGEPPPATF